MKNIEQPHTQHALSSTFCMLSVSGHHRKQKYMAALKMYRNRHSEALAYIPVTEIMLLLSMYQGAKLRLHQQPESW